MEGKENLTEAFLNAYQLMQRYTLTWYRKNFNGMEPWQGQGNILSALRERRSISQRELRRLLDMRPQSLGELLRKLEDGGYVTRYRLPTDKRSLFVKLTERGEKYQTNRPDYEELFVDLDEAARTELKAALEKVSARLREQIVKENDEAFY